MNEKQKKRLAALQRQQALVDAAGEGERELTDEERAEFDTLQRDIDRLSAEIEAEEARTVPEVPETSPAAKTDGQRDIAEERKRVVGITALCRDFGMEDELARFIEDGSSEDQVRALVVEKLRREKAPIPAAARIGNSGEDDFRRDAADGLLLRGGIALKKPSQGAGQFAHMHLRDLAIECLERAGVPNARRMGEDELLREVFSRQYLSPTAAFPTILDNAVEKAYVEGHRTVPVTFDQWTKKGTLKDFKKHDNNYLAGPIGEFEEVPEGGELKHDVPTDAKRPTRQLKTFGKQFTLSWQAFINDDIDLVTRIPARHAAAARKTINTHCYQILMGVGKYGSRPIYDGKPLFDKSHRNVLAKGTGVTKEAMQSMIMALSTQKDEFDQSIIIRPATVIVPAGCSFDMYTLFNSPTIQTTDNTQAVNPLYRYKDSLAIVEDPTINQLAGGAGNVMPWWLVGAREDTDFIEVDYLNGQEIPMIRRMETPGQLGFVWDIYLPWTVTVMDYRGAIKNPGVKIDSPLGLA